MVASIKPHRDKLGLRDGRMLIDGQWLEAAEGWSHRHPATGEQVASFPVAGPAEVDLAVRAARRAFDEGPWPRARANERVRVLRRIADLVRAHGGWPGSSPRSPACRPACST
jgi:aldehyde dehydrogenase (NAD+)